MANPDDLLLEVQGWGSPTTLLRGRAGAEEIQLAAALCVRYSDAPGQAAVSYGAIGHGVPSTTMHVAPVEEASLRAMRV